MRHSLRFAGLVLVPALGFGYTVSGYSISPASAEACPQVRVVFARGTGEPPGVGPTGQAFVDSLRSRLGGRPLDVYPVNYPASQEWSTGLAGIRDAGAHVESTATNCPNTKMVLGGYSQGAWSVRPRTRCARTG